jgi:hypothetical protein
MRLKLNDEVVDSKHSLGCAGRHDMLAILKEGIMRLCVDKLNA